MVNHLEAYIRTIENFPKDGIMFRDVTSLIANPHGFGLAIDMLNARYQDDQIDVIVGLEARGFIIGAALAQKMSLGFVPVRKKGKLPGETIEQEYSLEYGQAVVEMHTDALPRASRVLLIDDLLATGGTAAAGISLIERLGAHVVSCGFVVDLPDLGGRKRLENMGLDVHTLCAFEGE